MFILYIYGCGQVAQFSAELDQYETAVEIYEDIAKTSLENNLLKYSAKGYLLNAGICRLCCTFAHSSCYRILRPLLLPPHAS